MLELIAISLVLMELEVEVNQELLHCVSPAYHVSPADRTVIQPQLGPTEVVHQVAALTLVHSSTRLELIVANLQQNKAIMW